MRIFLSSLILFFAVMQITVPQICAQSIKPKTSTVSATPAKNAQASASATPAEIIKKLKQIEILKEKIATKVAEIREKERGAVAGQVSKINQSSIILTTSKGNHTISFSEDTIFYTFTDSTRQDINIKKLKEGDTVTVLGYFNQDKSVISAKYIYLEKTLLHIVGKIVDIDKSNYTITVKAKEGDKVIDIETSTRTFLYQKGKGWQKGGFSKLKLGDKTHTIVLTNPKDTSKVTAARLYLISPIASPSATISPTPLAK